MEAVHQAGVGRARSAHIDPRWPNLAIAMFAGAVPAMIALELLTAVLIFAIVPVGDLTPMLLLVIVGISRRWRGVAEDWLRLAKVLALVMVVEWAVAYVLVFGALAGIWPSDPPFVLFESVLVFYALESVTLLVIVAVGSAHSVAGLIRERDLARAERC